MNWFSWLFLSLTVCDVMVRILIVGKQREPITSGDAAFNILVNGLLTWGVCYFGMRP